MEIESIINGAVLKTIYTQENNINFQLNNILIANVSKNYFETIVVLKIAKQ